MSLRNGLWPTSGGRLGVHTGDGVWGTPAEKSGRHSGLTSSSSIPAQDSEPRRGGLMGWGEGLLPVSSWEDRGHHSDNTQLGRGVSSGSPGMLGRGKGVLVSQNPTEVLFGPPAEKTSVFPE